ncbi:efflux RND transporter periplasmic adaptor subunit [Aquabacterium sp. OR-4]|uniref:efflux RND transporter periplasmic adaptor subunit n=1 Tax=Aquabacterium sp. OR-4 TaxID=2978127 RepID=UPI0021B329E6|nr:efflux RND transporter periplasmic adaptor subunit [Aquabacterium sp. OR-4]MDT7838044.1 efflux RND transporter periplasmic adaptor subunit [Aquabacterium sp. OR-4]
MRRPSIAPFVLALASAAVLAACSAGQSATPPAGAATARPLAVGVQLIQPEQVAIATELPGRTTAPQVAEIRPQASGIVLKKLFADGALVRAGQVLFQIDPASYQAAVASAQAAVDKAQAVVQTSQLTAQRRAELLKIEAISQQDVQDAQATLAQAQADLAAARAALATARINLQRTEITSPITGRVDLSTVTVGALVTADQATALTTVRQMDPLQVDITQSSADLLRLKRELASGRLQPLAADARTGSTAKTTQTGKPDPAGQPASATEARVSLVLEDGSTYAHAGRLSVSSPAVNTSTGAVTLRAVFANPDGLLMPGMYVRAQLPTGVAAGALLVPQQAVSRDASGQASVLLVDADNKVRRQAIAATRAVGNRWLVDSGLQAGARVIVEGAQKVKVGDVVQATATPLATAS